MWMLCGNHAIVGIGGVALALLVSAAPGSASAQPCDESESTQEAQPQGQASLAELARTAWTSSQAGDLAHDPASCGQAPGSSRPVYTRFTGKNYRLDRLSDAPTGAARYEAVLNFKFVSDSAEPGGRHAVSPEAEQMSKRTDLCLAALGEIPGPGGETLHIRRAHGPEESSVPPNEIKVIPLMRPDNENWSKDSDCDTIVHEALHLLGLIDVYAEAESASQRADWDCRARGPADSVMAHASDALGAAYGFYRRVTCNCEQGEDYRACSRSLDAIKGVPAECPGASVTMGRGGTESVAYLNPVNLVLEASLPSVMLAQANRAGLSKGVRSKAWRFDGLRKEPASRGSLLYPAEFRMIARPGCAQENSLYIACASAAYVSSKDSGGCPRLPAACSDPNHWLR